MESYDFLEEVLFKVSETKPKIPCDTPSLHTAIYALRNDLRFRGHLADYDDWSDSVYYMFSESLRDDISTMEQVGVLELVGPYMKQFLITRRNRYRNIDEASVRDAAVRLEELLNQAESKRNGPEIDNKKFKLPEGSSNRPIPKRINIPFDPSETENMAFGGPLTPMEWFVKHGEDKESDDYDAEDDSSIRMPGCPVLPPKPK